MSTPVSQQMVRTTKQENQQVYRGIQQWNQPAVSNPYL